MGLTPSFRLPIALPEVVHPEVSNILQNHDDAITDLQTAIPALKSQIDALSATQTAAAASTENVTVESETVITSNVIGFVNDQSGETSYSTQQSDYGGFVLLDDASAIAVTLTTGPAIQLPWFTTFINSGTGTATLTPETGMINGSANFALNGGQTVTVVFDGTNFEVAPLAPLPVNTPAAAHEWLASYDAATGEFTQTQPDFSDVTGQITEAQLPSAGLSVTITTAQLTPTGTQGSMTYQNGILTAQTPAT